MDVTRERAWQTLTEYTQSEALRRHALAVEASVGAYAQKLGEDEEFWRTTALLHDFDYEVHPTLDKHPQDGAPILREQGYPEELIEAVLSHAEHLSLPRDTPLKLALFACDELSGFIHACGLVRPDGIETLEPKSVRKKLKQPSFAAGVNRDDVFKSAEELGVDLDEHIAFVIAAMRPIAAELGAAHPGGRSVTAQFDALGVVVADVPRSLTFYRRLGLEFPEGAESEQHVEATLPGGIRFMLDAEEMIRSIEPEWRRPSGKRHRPRVPVRVGCRRRRGPRRAHRRRLREPQGAVGRVLGSALRTVARPRRPRDRPLRAALERCPPGGRGPLSLVHQPHEARTSPVPGMSRTITPFFASLATVASGSASRNATRFAWPGSVTTSARSARSSRQRAAASAARS